MKPLLACFALCLGAAVFNHGVAATPDTTATLTAWSAESPRQQVRLLELFTSQGCSSCPPADRWLAGMKNRPDLWTAVVPVSWHVTYWDYLGWRDPFARSANDRRQRRLAEQAGSGVYTPGVFLDRAEWRGWRRQLSGQPAASKNPVGVLSGISQSGSVRVEFQPAEHLRLESPVLELVYLRSDQSTAVEKGENRGRQLRHEFVAGDLHRIELSHNGVTWTATLEAVPEQGSDAVALWVLTKENRYLQATGSWLAR